MGSAGSLPLITTIIPTYRRPRLLRRAIRSVLWQTYPHFRIRVYDNASGDETAAVVHDLAKEDARVQYHCHLQNIGGTANFRYGLERVETPFFSFLSDDDVLLPRFFETAMQGFDQHPGAAFSATLTIVMREDGTVLGLSLAGWPREGRYAPPEGLFEVCRRVPTWTSVLFRKSAVDAIGGLDPEVGGRSDFDLQLRIAALFPIFVSKKPGAIFVRHPSGYSSLEESRFQWSEWRRLVGKLAKDERLPWEVRDRAQRLLVEGLERWLFYVGRDSIKQRDWRGAHASAEALRMYGSWRVRPLILKGAVVVCQRLPGAHWALRAVSRVRKRLRGDGTSLLQEEFGHFARFLET